jgi:hypothetical protein
MGVHLVWKLEQIEEMEQQGSLCYPLKKTKPLAQEYHDSYTIEGHKSTIRVYVAITSLDPLRVYIFPNGLVRICSRK